eukprot:jgi/Bigna1/84057/fgenesh1_pg.121_\
MMKTIVAVLNHLTFDVEHTSAQECTNAPPRPPNGMHANHRGGHAASRRADNLECLLGTKNELLPNDAANVVQRFHEPMRCKLQRQRDPGHFEGSGWTSEQTGNLTDEHACEALGIDCFSAMRADAYAGFSFQCVANWRDNELGGGVTAKDIFRIPVESIGGLNDHDVLGWGRECAGFRADQLREMSGLACASLSPDCLESISPRACKEGFSRSRHSPCQSLTAKCGAASTDGLAALASTRRSTLVMTGGEKAWKESKTSDSPTSRSDAETATGPTLPDNPYYYNYYYSYRKQSRGPNNGLLDKEGKRGKHTSGLTAFSVAGFAAVASMSLIVLASSITSIWEKVRKSYLLTEYAELEVVSDNGKIGDVMMRMYKRRWGCA